MKKYLILLFSLLLIINNHGFSNSIKLVTNKNKTQHKIFLLNNSDTILDSIICNHENYSIDTINQKILISTEIILFKKDRYSSKEYYFTKYDYNSNKFTLKHTHIFSITSTNYADDDTYNEFLDYNIRLSSNRIKLYSKKVHLFDYELEKNSLRQVLRKIKFYLLDNNKFKETYKISYRKKYRYYNPSKIHYNIYVTDSKF